MNFAYRIKSWIFIVAALIVGILLWNQKPSINTQFVLDESIRVEPGESIDPATGEARPVGAMVDEDGVQDQFIANELLIEANDGARLSEFLTRYGASIVETIDFDPDPEDDLHAIHIVRIPRAQMADPAGLPEDLAVIDPEAELETFRISDEIALGLIATWAESRRDGLDVDINWLGVSNEVTDLDVLNDTLAENTTGPGDNRDWTVDTTTVWSSDPKQWKHFASGTAQDIGVADAWEMLATTGRIGDIIDVGYVDSGFADPNAFPNDDYPEDVEFNAVGVFVDEHGPGDSTVPWHGMRAGDVAFGQVNNNFGAAGVGYPVADKVLYAYFDFPVSNRKLVRAFRRMKRDDIQVFGTSVGYTYRSRFGGNRIRRVTARMMRNGIIVVAAAGNDTVDIDRTRRFGVRERRHYMPCEGRGVTCVGGLTHDSILPHPQSNWGNEDVDIWAPYVTVVGADPSCNGCTVQAFTGTSAASPFVVGAIALIWAANPDASRDDVLDALDNNARVITGSNVTKIINVRDSVSAMLTVHGPVLRLLSPSNGSEQSYSASTLLRASGFDAGLGVEYSWLVNGSTIAATSERSALSRDQLLVGPNTVRIEATFGDGSVLSATATVTRNVPGDLLILSPMDQQCIRASDAASNVSLQSRPSDPSVLWEQNETSSIGSGGDITASLAVTTNGPHQLRASLMDGVETDEDSVTIRIVPDAVGQSSVSITNPTETVMPGMVEFSANSSPATGSTISWIVDRIDGLRVVSGNGENFSAELEEGEYIVRVFLERDIDPDPDVEDTCLTASETIELTVTSLI